MTQASTKPSMTAQQEKFTKGGAAFSTYKELAVGDSSWLFFSYSELLQLVSSNLPGIFGFGLRSLAYPTLFNSCGARPAIGRGVLLRNPKQVALGSKVIIDDYAVLDARGDGGSIELGNYVSLGRFSTLAAKEGKVTLEEGVNVGSFCRIATQSSVHIGKSALIAAYAYIGPGNHQLGDADTPLISQEMDLKGGVEIGEHAWVGTRATILDGVKIGKRAIIGAHSLVKDDVPEGSIAVGVPAKVIGSVDE